MTARVMTAEQAFEKLLGDEDLFILDVRNEEDYADWKIEGSRAESINIPYFELLEGVGHILQRLPEGREILVACAKEGSSKFVAEQLVEAGRTNISYLQGGMKAWSEYIRPVKIGDLKDGGELYQFVRVGKGCLSYMILSAGEAAVVDAVRMTDVFVRFAEQKGVQIKHVLDTHLHADHISGGRELEQKKGAAYWLPPKDAAEVTFPYRKLQENEDIRIGGTHIQIKPIYSPGHTIGSTTLLVDQQYLLTGDILFVESIGRPDLAGKAEDWVSDLRNTLYETYVQLPKDLVVLPAHFGKPGEMDEKGSVQERLGNLYERNQGLQIDDAGIFRKLVTENLPPQPNAYQEIREVNMGKLQPSDEEQREMEIGPNRCAVHA